MVGLLRPMYPHITLLQPHNPDMTLVKPHLTPYNPNMPNMTSYDLVAPGLLECSLLGLKPSVPALEVQATQMPRLGSRNIKEQLLTGG